MSPAWQLDLPAPRTTVVGDLRIAAWIDDEYCPVDDDTAGVLTELCTALADAGASVDRAARPAFTLEYAHGVFDALLFAALAGGHSRDKIEHMATDTSDTAMGRVKRGTAARHRNWLSAHERQLQLRAKWADFFSGTDDDPGFDALLMPVHPRAAIARDHSPQWECTVEIGGIDKSYLDMFTWIAPLESALQARSSPSEWTATGYQLIIGLIHHNRVTLEVARHVAALTDGYPTQSD